MTTDFTKNNLEFTSSPYLQQHSHQPVHWQEWSQQTLAYAHKQNKPLLVSIGYAACHWCHVMAHESFDDKDIAQMMNANFVNIKIDREERPDLDYVYQNALGMMGQQGGWPLTMFCSPFGEPFWGGTYFPPTARYGRPSFHDVLLSISDTYIKSPHSVSQNIKILRDEMASLSQAQEGQSEYLSLSLINDICESLISHFDPMNGGLEGAPKFPNWNLLMLLWRAYLRTRDQKYKLAVTITCNALVQGGIYDHLGGGIARYAVDDEWLIPHFEKMLYDNAQCIMLLTEVWRETQDDLYKTKVHEIVDWLCREMRAGKSKSQNAFGAALDADSLNDQDVSQEGAFYTWTKGEIENILPKNQASLISRIFDISDSGNWEDGRNILHRRHDHATLEPQEKDIFDEACKTLFSHREKRSRPFYDDKVLTDWNGLAIQAITHAGRIFEQPNWCKLAQKSYQFICKHVSCDQTASPFDDKLIDNLGSHILAHSWRGGQVNEQSFLDDYVFMIAAALDLYGVTADKQYLVDIDHWLDICLTVFWDYDRGGFFQTAQDPESKLCRPKIIHDQAVPSGNGQMLQNLTRLQALVMGDEEIAKSFILNTLKEHKFKDIHDLVTQQQNAFAGEVNKNLYGLFSYLCGVENAFTCPSLKIVNPKKADQTNQNFVNVLRQHSWPDLMWVDVYDKAIDKDDRSYVLLCAQGTCQPPFHCADELNNRLSNSSIL